MSESKQKLTWDSIEEWIAEYPVLAAFLIAVVIVVIVGIGFLISWVVGLVIIGVGLGLAGLTWIIYGIIDYNSF